MTDSEVFIWDIEIYSNLFICNVWLKTLDGTKHEHCFRVGERDRARKAFARRNCWYCGHNILGYDIIMLALWLDGANETQLFQLNNYLILQESPDDPKVRSWIKNNVRSSSWEKFGQIRYEHKLNYQAMKDHGWNNTHFIDTLILGEKVGSLKNAAINLGMKSLVEAPVEFGIALKPEEIDLVIAYCFNDNRVVEKLLEYYKTTIEIRKKFFDMGIKQAYVVGSAKLAELYLCKRLHEQMGDDVAYKTWERNARLIAKGHRDFDPVCDLIGDYKIKYFDKGFTTFWNRLKPCDLLYKNSDALKDYETEDSDSEDSDDWKKKLSEPSAFRNRTHGLQLPKGDLVITDDRGMVYQFGMGGLHNIAERGVWKESEEMAIYNVDVTSYYPSLIVQNSFTPRQFVEFAAILDRLLEERKISKAQHLVLLQLALKLVLNSSFGKTKDRNSLLFDPKCFFSVTVSGQVLLLLLIDYVYAVSPEAYVINANTDGVCFYLPRKDLERVKEVMRVWEKVSKVNLEDEFYSVWAQKACNLYTALTDHGKIKSKGRDFKVRPDGPKAMAETMAEAPATKLMIIEALLKGKHPQETCAEMPKEDFCMSMGFGGKRTLVVDGVAQKSRRALRYAWVKEGSILQKSEKRGISIVGEGRKCQIVDDTDALDDANIDKKYYIEKAMTKVLELVGEHTTLNLPKAVLKNILANFDYWLVQYNKGK